MRDGAHQRPARPWALGQSEFCFWNPAQATWRREPSCLLPRAVGTDRRPKGPGSRPTEEDAAALGFPCLGLIPLHSSLDPEGLRGRACAYPRQGGNTCLQQQRLWGEGSPWSLRAAEGNGTSSQRCPSTPPDLSRPQGLRTGAFSVCANRAPPLPLPQHTPPSPHHRGWVFRALITPRALHHGSSGWLQSHE